MSENIILIPVYNDWKSLNHLLFEINKRLNNSDLIKILIVNDCSTQEINIDKKNLATIREIKILSLNQNLGSQKSIAIGLDYLKKLNDNFYITIMDADGEDSPSKLNKMLLEAKKNTNYIITSHRKRRNENFIIRLCYKIHLLICLLLTWNWISFGNFSCFHSSNLKKLFLNNSIWHAYSAGVLKNCKIKKLYAVRQKRYFESSKVNFLQLAEHSLRVIGVFYERVVISSFFFLFLIWLFSSQFNILFYSLILLFNFLILTVKVKNHIKTPINYINLVKNIKII